MFFDLFLHKSNLMKWYTLGIFFFTITSLFGQAKTIPSIEIKTMDGKLISTDSITNNGKPIILSFWATWCKPCIKELSTFAENYDDWVEETGVKLFAISIDDQRSFASVKATVNGKGWPFTVYCDPNGDLKRALNVVNVPHTFILDGNRQIFWQHSSFAEGSEEELIEQVKKIATKP